MNDLGVCRHTGIVYEGSPSSGGTRVTPPPLLLPVKFESDPATTSNESASFLPPDIFREDNFDPTTRIRRGRVYTRRHLMQPTNWYVQDPLRTDLEQIRLGPARVAQQAELCTYQRASLVSRGIKIPYPRVVLGAEPYVSIWELILVETSATDFPLLTLRAVRTFGDLPMIALDRVEESARRIFSESWIRLEEIVTKGSAVDVVDRCRDVLAVIFRLQTSVQGAELAALIDTFSRSKREGREDLVTWCGRIVARLHARKPNKQMDEGLRAISEDDALLAIKCVAFIVTELGLAK